MGKHLRGTLVLLAIFCADSFADILYLKDGSIVKGQIKIQNFKDNTLTFITERGITNIYEFDDIERIANDTQEETLSTDSDQASTKSYSFLFDEGELPVYELSLGSSSVNYFLSDNLKDVVSLDGMDFGFQYLINNYLSAGYGFYWGNTLEGSFNGKSRDLAAVTNLESIYTKGMRTEIIGGYNIQESGLKALLGLGVYAEYTTERTVNDTNIQDRLFGYQAKIGLGYQWHSLGLQFWNSFRTDQAKGFVDGSTQQNFALTYRFQ